MTSSWQHHKPVESIVLAKMASLYCNIESSWIWIHFCEALKEEMKEEVVASWIWNLFAKIPRFYDCQSVVAICEISLFYSFEKCPGVGGFLSVVTICEFSNIILEVFVSFIHSAICPYLALETCRQWHLSSRSIALMRTGTMPTMTVESKPSRISRRWCHKHFVALRLVDLGTSYRVCHWGCLLALCQNTCSEVLFHSPAWVLWYVHICPEICLCLLKSIKLFIIAHDSDSKVMIVLFFLFAPPSLFNW